MFSILILSTISGVGICLRSVCLNLFTYLDPCFEFLFDVPIKTRVVVSYGACANVCFVCVNNYCVKVLYCLVNFIVVSKVECL